MKVLFHGYNTCFQNTAGGIQTRMRKLQHHLIQSGVDVSFFAPESTDLSNYDVLHLFRLDFENYALVKCAKEKGLRIVISSVVPINNGKRIDLLRFVSKLPLLTTFTMMRSQLCMADSIISETPSEAQFICNHYKIETSKIRVIPNGLDELNPCMGREVYDVLGFNSDYVLCVGRFDSNKNQLNLIKAMKNSGIETVFIGGPGRDSSSYYDLCLKEADGCNNIHFLGWLEYDSALLKSAYSNCKLLVLPSYNETFGLAILEAVSAGANVAVSSTLPILDYGVFGKDNIFSPNDADDIRKVVTNIYNQPKPTDLYEKMKMAFSWESIVTQHIDCYSGH